MCVCPAEALDLFSTSHIFSALALLVVFFPASGTAWFDRELSILQEEGQILGESGQPPMLMRLGLWSAMLWAPRAAGAACFLPWACILWS